MHFLAQPKGKVEFRIITNADEEFLANLYATTRDREMAQSGWSDIQKDLFLRGQFKAQSQAYATTFLNASHRIIQLDGIDIGRLIVDRQDDCLRLIDLSILPFFRGRGIGSDIVRSLMKEADGGKVPMRLHALKNAPALNMYLRLGFKKIRDVAERYELEWRPNGAPKVS